MTSRPGFVLPLSVLMAMALSLIGLGIMAAAIREAAIARALDGREHARVRAESAAIDVVEGWSTRAHTALGIGESRVVPHPTAEVAVFRIDSALFLVRAVATAGIAPWGEATARAGLLVRAFDVGRAVRYFPAAISADREARLEGGRVRGGDSCTAGPAVIADSILLRGTEVVGRILERASEQGTDPFPPELLAAASARVGPGLVRPAPLMEGPACQTHPRNWGAPDSGHPCYGLRPFVFADGPLRVAGGTGRGILVVDGDLILDGDFHYSGLIVVRGQVILRGRVRIEGAIHAVSLVFEEGQVTGAPCDLPEILASPALDRAFRPPSRWWVPVW